jgi:hypothetical protein
LLKSELQLIQYSKVARFPEGFLNCLLNSEGTVDFLIQKNCLKAFELSAELIASILIKDNDAEGFPCLQFPLPEVDSLTAYSIQIFYIHSRIDSCKADFMLASATSSVIPSFVVHQLLFFEICENRFILS